MSPLIVWFIIMLGMISNHPEFFIVGGVLAVLNLLHVFNRLELEPPQNDSSKCPPHNWTHSISGEVYCEKCKNRPGDIRNN